VAVVVVLAAISFKRDVFTLKKERRKKGGTTPTLISSVEEKRK